ncbi:hypothetical protein G6F23_010961 [Rhizopus arrhizus]|nr:hypothetical protein G6F23_010961 [Rhizopus arrhizus]
MDAINIATEVEQALLKSMGKSSNGNLSSVYTPNNTTTTTNYGISSSGSHNTNTDQQNFQRHNNGNNNFKNNRRYNNNDKRQQQRGESRKCFNCNKIGHISKDCRSPKRHRENKTNQQTIHNDDKDEMDNIFDHLMQQNQQTTPTPVNTLQFSINATTKNNSIKQNCLIDTGSTLSSIRQSTATRLGLYEFNTQPRRIEYGNGGLQLTTKKAIFEFKINNLPTRAFLYIVEKQNEEVILGMDWMTYEDIVLHPKTKTITKNSSEQQNLQQVQHDEQTNDEITNEEFLAQTILNEFPKLIPNDNGPQTVTNAPYMHRIDTGDALPVHVRDYRRPFAENEQIKKEVDEMLRKKVIEPSTSAWCSPVVMIKKHDESWRFCVDFRKLNAVTIKDKFPIGNLNEVLDKLHGCKYLSTIDLKSGFWQIPMDPRDAHKTAFIANGALYQFKVLPFGCVTGPNSFSRFMHGVIQNLPRVMVYLDDVICFSRTKEEHEQDLRALLQRLSEYNLKISVKKCRFFKKEVKYLGFIVSSNGIRSDPEKIEAIKEWPTPTTVKALQRFLGFCAFYHRFIKNLSQTAAPMYALLRKDAPFVWSKEADQAFITLKIIIMTLPTLAYPDPHKPYDVHTDASMFGLGAIIVQNGRPNKKLYVLFTP